MASDLSSVSMLNGVIHNDDNEEAEIQFPSEVEAAIAAVLPSDDPLDQPDFNATEYINDLFPSEQSLAGLDDVITDLKCKIGLIDDDMRKIVRSQTQNQASASEALMEAQDAILKLFTQIRDIKVKATESEATVRDITRDIKQLDVAKRNLTASITTLNHLHMLVGGVAQLRVLASHRQYGEASMLLQGLMEVMDHFQPFSDIPQIRELSDQVKSIKMNLGQQITSDFEVALSVDNSKHFTPTKQMAEACLVVSVLDPKVRANLIKWLLKHQLAEYSIIFGRSAASEEAWLDRVETRYTWLKRHLIEFEERLGPMFPPDWEMSERIAVEFCNITKADLETLMFKRKLEIDPKLLLHVIQKTAAFESLLSRRFTGITLIEEVIEEKPSTNPFEQPEENEELDKSNPFYEEKKPEKDLNGPQPHQTKVKNTQKPSKPFEGIISQCFEPYLHIYLESQDRNLTDLIERAAEEEQQRKKTNLASEGSAVLHSCGDLFMFYKKCMQQCAQLKASGEPMMALTSLFKKHLREYATKVLVTSLPSASSSSGNNFSLSKAKDFSTAFQNIQSLLVVKETEVVKLSDNEKVLVCTILVTAEYCLETTQQLETKLKEKLAEDHPNLSEKVNLGPEQDVFHSVVSSCITTLVHHLEAEMEPFLIAMTKVNWAMVEAVGDQSPYVTSIVNAVKDTVPVIRNNLASSRKYFTQFCIKFANSFIPQFLMSLYKCKPLGMVGAEQLLLDTHSIKTVLLDLPSVGESENENSTTATAVKRKPPAAYVKIVVKGMTRAEMTLKVIMSPSDPAAGFVQQFIKLVPEADAGEFVKVLDMKGIRKADQANFLDAFRSTAPSHLVTVDHQGSPGEESKIKKLEKMIKKRL